MKRQRKQSDRGQAFVEFALILPVLLLIVLGIIQFGSLYNNDETITNATRAGARVAAVSRTASDPVGTTIQAVKNAAPNLTQSQINVTVTPAPPWQPGGTVTVTATYPYSINLLGMVVKSGNLSSSTTERIE
jgi:Flp pilus assembly protein TadG